MSAVVKEYVVPDAGRWAMQLADNKFKPPKAQVYQNVNFFNASGRRLWQIPEIDLGGRTATLRSVSVTQERPDGSLAEKMFAVRADYLDGQWWFFDAQRLLYTLDGNPIGEMKPIPGSDRGIEMRGMNERPADFANEVLNWQLLSVRAMERYLRSHPALSVESRTQRQVDMRRRQAMPWACLVVTLFAIPAGARNARQSVIIGVLMTIACFFAFYLFLEVGVLLAKRQLLEPWLGAWFSNFAFFAAGVGMLIRIR